MIVSSAFRVFVSASLVGADFEVAANYTPPLEPLKLNARLADELKCVNRRARSPEMDDVLRSGHFFFHDFKAPRPLNGKLSMANKHIKLASEMQSPPRDLCASERPRTLKHPYSSSNNKNF